MLVVEVEYARNNRVVVVKYTGRMATSDVKAAVNSVGSALQTASLPVHNISDISSVTMLPPNLIGNLRNYQELFRSPMLGTIALVSSNLFFNAIAKAFVRALPFVRIQIFPTVPDAWAEIDRILAEENPT